MEWILESKNRNEGKAPRDYCPAYICYKDGGGGGCGWRWCVTEVCFIDS